MSNRFQTPNEQFSDSSGNPYAGGKLNFYLTGTSTRQNTYSDAGRTTANANPVILDSAGRSGNVFLTPGVNYKVVLTDSDDVQVWTADPVSIADDDATYNYDTVTDAAAATVPASVKHLRVSGYASVGDRGAALYKRSTTEPSHSFKFRSTDRFLPDGTSSSVNGGWWENVEIICYPEMIGAVAGDTATAVQTANVTAIQALFNLQRDTGRAIGFDPDADYYVNDELTHQRNSTSGPDYWVIHGNNSRLNFASSGLTTGTGLTLGATSQANMHDDGYIIMPSHLWVIGPETATVRTSAASTTFKGFELHYFAGEARVQAVNCYIGIETEFAFPVLGQLCGATNCLVGIHIIDDSTYAVWNMPNVRSCRFAYLIRPSSSATVSNQLFVGPRLENSAVGFVIDDRGGTVNSIKIVTPYIEDITNDVFRLGYSWSETAATIGSATSGNINGFDLEGGVWSHTVSSTAAAVRANRSAVVGGSIKIPVDLTDSDALPSVPDGFSLQSLMDQITGGSAQMSFWAPAEGWVVFDGTNGNITEKSPLVDSVTRAAQGNYTITLRASVKAANRLAVLVDTNNDDRWYSDNKADGSFKVYTLTSGGSAVDRSNTFVWFKGIG